MKIKIFPAVAALLAILESSASAQVQVTPTTVTGTASASASSWLAGAQAGYNWQRGPWVYGLAADISGMHLNNQANNVFTGTFFSVPTSVNSTIDWYGTVRGRLGCSSGPRLFYGTAGFAYGGLNLSSSLTFPPVSLNAQTSSVHAGWVAGAGMEYMWTPNVLVSLEYQYVDLGTDNVPRRACVRTHRCQHVPEFTELNWPSANKRERW